MHRIWAIVGLALVLLPGIARAEAVGLEVEAGAGLEDIELAAHVPSPMLAVRAGIDLYDRVTFSARAETYVGSGGLTGRSFQNRAGHTDSEQAWALFPELRLHTAAWAFQGYAGLGVGAGRLTLIEASDEFDVQPAAFGQLCVGGKVQQGPVAFTLEVGLKGWLLDHMGVDGTPGGWEVKPSAQLVLGITWIRLPL